MDLSRTGDLYEQELKTTVDGRELPVLFCDFDRLLMDPDVTDIRIEQGYGLYYRKKGIVHSLPCHFHGIDNLRTQFCAHVHAYDYEGNSLAATHLGFRLRIEIGSVMQGEHRKIWIRRLDPEIPTLETMGYTELVAPATKRVMDKSQSGLVIVAGPTSSGKSTLLASLMQHILNNNPAHVCTIEDPIEYVLKPGNGEVSQHQIGPDAETPEKGLKTILRKDPNVILIGELRDALFASTAVDAAETGHLTLATVHAADVVGVLQRLESLAGENDTFRTRLSSVMMGIIVLRLKYKDDDADGGEPMAGRETETLWIRGHPERRDIMTKIAEGKREGYNYIASLAETRFIPSVLGKARVQVKKRSEFADRFDVPDF